MGVLDPLKVVIENYPEDRVEEVAATTPEKILYVPVDTRYGLRPFQARQLAFQAKIDADVRNKVIFWGITAAVVLRILFAAVTTQLLQIIGLTLAGGLLLLWVCWKMYRELRSHGQDEVAPDEAMDAKTAAAVGGATLGAAIWQIVVADVSMSLDNVLAVAGAARDHMGMLVFGLVLSIALMGVAASMIAATGRYASRRSGCSLSSGLTNVSRTTT